jgi:hypothetical protein
MSLGFKKKNVPAKHKFARGQVRRARPWLELALVLWFGQDYFTLFVAKSTSLTQPPSSPGKPQGGWLKAAAAASKQGKINPQCLGHLFFPASPGQEAWENRFYNFKVN